MENPYKTPLVPEKLHLPEFLDIDFLLTPDDIAAFNLHFYTSYKHARARRWLLPAFMLAVATWMLISGFRDGHSLFALAPYLLFIAFLGLIGIFMSRRRIRKFTRNIYSERPQLGIIGDMNIRIEKTGINTANPYRRTWVSWQAIEKTAVTKDHLFIYHGSATAFVIPRTAFGNHALFVQFAELAEKFRLEASHLALGTGTAANNK